MCLCHTSIHAETPGQENVSSAFMGDHYCHNAVQCDRKEWAVESLVACTMVQ